jgi:membrane protein required for colicin V production
MRFTSIDVVFGVLVLLLMIRSLIRGLIQETMSVAQWFLGLLLAFVFYRSVSAWLEKTYFPGNEILSDVLAFAGIFIFVFIGILILEKILRDIVNGISLGGIDHFLGALFGILEGLLVVVLALWLLEAQPFADLSPIYENSFSFRLLGPLAGSVNSTAARIIAP